MGDVEEFEEVGSGAAAFHPEQCSKLRKGGHVLIKGRPCKIMEMSTSKTGKHGHAKVHLVGIDVFSGKKYEDLCPSTHNMDVPEMSRVEYTLIDVQDDGFVSLMRDDGSTKDDLKSPEGDLGEQIKQQFADGKELVCTVLASMGEEAIMQVRESAKS